jgi:hypothetical protein
VAAARDVVATDSRRQATDVRGLEGFRVDGPDGRIGTVTAVSSSTPGRAADTLHVVTGLFIMRVVSVGAPHIVAIDRDGRRVLIRMMLRAPRSSNIARMLRRFLASAGRR